MSRSQDGLLRVLARGGMVIRCAEGYGVYLSQDARRGSVGVLSAEQFDLMCAQGALAPISAGCERWAWHAGTELSDQTHGACALVAPAYPRTPRQRCPSVLEASLMRVEDVSERRWIARAIARFLGDCERQSAVQPVTMNWAFELSGHTGGRRRGTSGMTEVSLSACKTLEMVEAQLGRDDFKLLESVLVVPLTKRKLCSELMLAGQDLYDHVATTLRRLARLYDRAVPASDEHGG